MKRNHNGRYPLKWTIVSLTVLISAGLAWGLLSPSRFLTGQTPAAPAPKPNAGVFTPGHYSVMQAAKEFFDVRGTPVQPIAYTHKVHVTQEKLPCTTCHEGVEIGPQAMIPSVNKCMTCHDITATDKPEVQKINGYYERGEEIPWQRVYGFPPMSHVRFNHAPHIRNKVDCATCHGDIPNMTVAQRVVDHTMGFCVKCHEQRKVSNDCLTCHY